MPDALTIRLQEELEKRGKAASLTQIDEILEQSNLRNTTDRAPTNSTVWDMLNTGRADEVFAGIETQEQEGDFDAFRLVGVAAWNALDIATLGIAGAALDPKDYLKKAAAPRNFSERVAGALGGLGGFLVPFAGARAVAGKAVSKFAPQGIGRISKSIVDDTAKVLKQDKGFMKWWGGYAQKNKLGPDDFNGFVKNITDYPISKIGTLGSKLGQRAVGSVEGRALFVKEFRENVPKVVDDLLGKTTMKDVGGLSKTLSDEIIKHVGEIGSGAAKRYKFPTLNLQEYLASATPFGSGKLVNLAASAAEEAILFSAVEMPMHVIQSKFEDDVEWNPMGTLGHAVFLGSALGLFRYIPGGKGVPIAPTVFKRVVKASTRKKRYAKYDTSLEADRIALGTHMKAIAAARPGLMDTLRKEVITPGHGGETTKTLFSTGGERLGQEIEKFVSTEKGAQEIKKLLMTIEDTFLKKWWPGFLKEAPGDIWGSLPRMTAVSLAFNFPLYLQWMRDGNVPLQDIIFHTGLGAVLGKRGKQLSYIKDGQLVISEKNKPYQYSEDFQKVDEYLNIIQQNPESSLYRMYMNDYNALKRGWGGTDKESKDMQEFLRIAKSNGMIVEDATKYERKNNIADGKTADDTHELYDDFAGLVSLNFLDRTKSQLVKHSSELTDKQINKIVKELRDYPFEGLRDFRGEHSAFPGVVSTPDIFNVTLASAGPQARKVMMESKRAVIDVYDEVLKIEAAINGTTPELITDWGSKVMTLRAMEVPSHVFNNDPRLNDFLNNAIQIIVDSGQARFNPNSKSKIMLTREMIDAIVGKRSYDADGRLQVDEPGVLDKWDDKLTEMILEEDVSDITRKIHVGSPLIYDNIRSVVWRSNIKDTWSTLNYIFGGKYDEGRPFGALNTESEYQDVTGMMRQIFEKDGAVVTDIVLTKYDTKGRKRAFSTEEIRNNRDYTRSKQFIDGILRVLRMDVANKKVSGGFGAKNTTEVPLATVNKLRKSFQRYNIAGFSLRDPVQREKFIDQLAEFTLDRSISGMTKNDGTPLTMSDRAVLRVLLESRSLSGNFTVPNFEGFIDNLDTLKSISKAFIKGNEFKVLSDLMNRRGYERVSENTQNFIDAIHHAAKQMEIEPENYFQELKLKWNKVLSPFMKNEKGGFVKVDSKAVIDVAHLTDIVELIHSMETAKYETSHTELIKAINESKASVGDKVDLKTRNIKRFLEQVHSTIQGKPGDAHRALQLLIKHGIYDSKSGFFNWSDYFTRVGTTKAYDLLKQIEQKLFFNFSTVESNSAYERLHEIHTAEAKHITDLTKSVSTSLDSFIKKYDIQMASAVGETPAKILRSKVFDTDKPYTLDNFMKEMMDLSSFKHDEVIYKALPGFLELGTKSRGQDKQIKFLMEGINVFATLSHGREVTRIHASRDNVPQHTEEIIKTSGLTDFMDSIGLKLTLVDSKFRIKGRQATNIMQTLDKDLVTEFYNRIAQAAAIGKKGLGDTAQTLSDVVKAVPHIGEPGATGNYVAWLGNFNNGIAIPISRSNDISMQFLKLWDSKIAEWQESGVLKQDKIKTIQREFDSWISKRFNIERDEKTNEILKVEYRQLYDVDAQTASHDFSTMITTMFGSKTMGNEFWDAVVRDWSLPEDFAQNVMRRIKLVTNRSHTTLSDKYTGEVIDFFDNLKLPAVKKLKKEVLPLMKTMKKKGILFHILRDEKLKGEKKHPGITSVLEQYNLQLSTERGNNPNEAGALGDSKEHDGELLFGSEGLGDASVVNSVNIVSLKTMEAIKAFLGYYDKVGILHGKPIGAKSSDSNMVMIDKTAFVVDADWSGYLEKNKINGVMFTSSTKMLGTGYNDRIITFEPKQTMEQFLLTEHLGKEVSFNLDDFSFGSMIKDEKDATISLQIGADLVGRSLNKEFYNWVMGDRVAEYFRQTSWFRAGNLPGMESVINSTNNSIFDTVEGNAIMSTMEVWRQGTGNDGGSHFFPFKRSINNSLKKLLVDKAGLFSPNNPHGSQSIMSPSYFTYGQDGHLRNTIFRKISDTEREVWTYGEIQIDDNNRYKRVDWNRIRVIEHKDNGRDEILSWGEFADKNNLSADERKFFLDGDYKRKLGDIHDFIQKVNKGEKYTLIDKKRRKSYTDSLSKIAHKSRKNLESISDAVIKSKGDKDNKFLFLKENVDIAALEKAGKIEKDTKEGERVKRRDYKGIRIVGDYYKITTGRRAGDDLIFIDSISDAKAQFENYKASGAKVFTGIEFGSELLGKKGVKQPSEHLYQVAVVAQRMPSTRPSDKIIVGLKGFGLKGNQARINSIDALTRLESDFDLDKINYWWDTPPDILKEWSDISGKVDAVKPEGIRTSVEGLNILRGDTLEKYAFDDQKAAYFKGIYVKTRRVIQWLNHYKGSFPEINGMSFKSLSGAGRVTFDEDALDVINQTITRDIQTILDAQKGFDENRYNAQYMDKILFGDESNPKDYPGLFKISKSSKESITRKGVTRERTVWDDLTLIDDTSLDAMAIRAITRPYNRLLQITSGIYDTGVRENVDYSSMLSYSKNYHWQMNNMHKYVYNSLAYNIKDTKGFRHLLDSPEYFGSMTKTPNLSGVKIDINNTATNLLPFERSLHFIAHEDHLRVPTPDRIPKELREKVDDSFADIVSSPDTEVQIKTEEAAKNIYQSIRKDVKNISTLNYIQKKN